MRYLYEDEHRISPMFELSVESEGQTVLEDLFVDGMHAREMMHRLARAYPEHIVFLTCMSRVKARLSHGKFTVRSMDEFYSNLSEEELAATKIYIAAGEWA